MVGVALLGAGIFAKEEHLPAILAAQKSGLGTLKAVYSRSQSSAEKLITEHNLQGVEAYFDSPQSEGKSLHELLSRADIDAVIVALPILNQGKVIEEALKAGKHVLSEKPIAQDVAAAKALLNFYESELSAAKKPIWAVAENFRFYKSLDFAQNKVAELGGKVKTFKLEMYGFIQDENKYYNTEWRKVPDYQGGFLLDGGVHFVAALRTMLGAAGTKIDKVVAFSNLLVENLKPTDTVHAVALTDEQIAGTIIMTFGTEFKAGLSVEVTTENGTVVWTPRDVRVQGVKDGQKVDITEEFERESGVKTEVRAFLEAVKRNDGTFDQKQSPREALGDLQVVQALLQSGDKARAASQFVSIE
ncbi:NAD(P)-binding protein [Rhypophila decipiens]|uniref:NAD(P)-binding protein n=1 Tax=Rhypophila decipiens TaxID=261697 RepID=A0AAN6XT96_9PEZI|nr:NAD(P)-binding protein [Rhypophila decipiens]